MDIFEFEEKYKSTLEDIEEWAYLRIAVGFYLKNQNNNIKVTKLTFSQKLKNKFKVIQQYKNIFYGFRNWFRKYDYIFFTYTDQRKIINEIAVDKLSDPIIKKLEQKGYKALMIEKANPVRFDRKKIDTKYIVSRELLNIVLNLFIMFCKIKFFKNMNNLILIEAENFLENIDLKKQIINFRASESFYSVLFSLYKPKGIFIICSYCNMPIVKAAKKYDIKVIELQHGVISKKHFGYISEISFDKNYFPDLLLSFGENEKEIVQTIDTIEPIGSYYMEYLSNHFYENKALNEQLQKYEIIIGISMQEQEWERKIIFDFLNKFANKNKSILYIIIPRFRKGFPVFPDNIIVLDDTLDCYQTIMYCDIHMTLYSSCALEVPSFGIPNILLNSKNFAKDFYGNILNTYHTKYLQESNLEDFFPFIDILLKLDKSKIIENNQDVFKIKYDNNINFFIKEYL